MIEKVKMYEKIRELNRKTGVPLEVARLRPTLIAGKGFHLAAHL